MSFGVVTTAGGEWLEQAFKHNVRLNSRSGGLPGHQTAGIVALYFGLETEDENRTHLWPKHLCSIGGKLELGSYFLPKLNPRLPALTKSDRTQSQLETARTQGQ